MGFSPVTVIVAAAAAVVSDGAAAAAAAAGFAVVVVTAVVAIARHAPNHSYGSSAALPKKVPPSRPFFPIGSQPWLPARWRWAASEWPPLEADPF